MRNRRAGWTLVGAVLAAAATLTIAACGGGHHHGDATPSARTTRSASATPSGCRLRVTDTGFANRYDPDVLRTVPAAQGEIQYAFVVDNPCTRSAVGTHLVAEAVDAAGKAVPYRDQLDDGGVGEQRSLPTIPPGGRLGVAGMMPNGAAVSASGAYDATAVAGIKVVVVHSDWQDPATPAAGMSARGPTVGARGQDGYVPVTFTLQLAGAKVDDWMSIIIRDRAGRIVSGEVRSMPPAPLSGQTVQTGVWVPPGATDLHAEIYFVPDGF